MISSPLSGRSTPLAQAAWWLNQTRSGDMSAYDARAFQVWLAEDPLNAQAYRTLERRWEQIGALAQDPEIMASRERDGRTFNRPSRLRMIAALAACLVLAVTAGVTLVSSGLLSHFVVAPEAEAQTFRTSVGQRMTATLPDGSIVTLDTDTVIRLRETPTRRLVDLDRGRAFFRVAKDPSRPFIVAVTGKTVQATGTAFDVRVEPHGVAVTLVEGRVRVEQPPAVGHPRQRADMVAGSRLVARDSEDWTITRVDLRKEMSWLEGRLTFFHDPLAQAVTEINRYSEKKVVFRDGRVPNANIVGVFRAGDVESFAKAVQMNHMAHITASSEDRIEMTASAK